MTLSVKLVLGQLPHLAGCASLISFTFFLLGWTEGGEGGGDVGLGVLAQDVEGANDADALARRNRQIEASEAEAEAGLRRWLRAGWAPCQGAQLAS